uniref:LysM domain-containing protein n=1 Tax=Manihot esculenta TaxID=3983 RepID=A0A2C9W1Y0_MANES
MLLPQQPAATSYGSEVPSAAAKSLKKSPLAQQRPPTTTVNSLRHQRDGVSPFRLRQLQRIPSTKLRQPATILVFPQPSHLLDVGQSLLLPLPCTCFNGTDNSLPAIYLSYTVIDTLAGIVSRYSTAITDLMNVNAMGNPAIKAGDVLAVPLRGNLGSFESVEGLEMTHQMEKWKIYDTEWAAQWLFLLLLVSFLVFL